MNNNSVRPVIRVVVLGIVVLANLLLAHADVSAIGNFAWARRLGGPSEEFVNHIEVDSTGNVYTTGYYFGTTDLDPGPGTANLTSTGLREIFVSKLDSQGDFVWARSMGGVNWDHGQSLDVDSSGNVYVTGHFQDTADFDPGPGTANLTSVGPDDNFTVRLDGDGNLVWARSQGGKESNGIVVDTGGNVYTAGTLFGIGDFDPGPGIANLTSAGSDDIFISKLDRNGNFVWAKSMGGPGSERSIELAVDMDGNVYSTGSFIGTIDFDPGPGIANLTSAGIEDIFIVKLDAAGNFVWAHHMGGADSDDSFDLTLDASGNVYTAGSLVGTADFDPGPGTFLLTSAGVWDGFVSKLDSDGNFVWARRLGGASTDSSYSLAVDAGGNVYTTGIFMGTVDFDPGPGMANLVSAGSQDIFIAKLDSNGDYAWARRLGGVDFDHVIGIAVDPGLSVHTTGVFQGTIDFDPGPGTMELTSLGAKDMFIVKLDELENIFEDVPPGYWAQTFIERLYMAGITGGCSTSPLNYCPEETVTRAQMAVFLLRGIHTASYTPPDVAGTTGFADVPTDYWAAAFIKQLAAEGITSGCGGGNYCPEAPVTRAQMAVFLLRSKYGSSYTPPAVDSVTGFGDVSPDYWAAAFIKQLVTEGITAGCGSGNYCPDQPVTRAQMAVFLVRTFSLP